MKIGKLPENVLVRSVLRQVSHRRSEVLLGPAVGQDCAALQIEEDEVFVLSADPITGSLQDLGQHCVYLAVNDLAASGATPLGLMLTMMLPEKIEEPQIRQMMQDVDRICEKLDIEVLGGHTEVTALVNQPLLMVTAVGKVKKTQLKSVEQMKPHQDLIISKWIGLEATAILAKEKTDELLKTFSSHFIDTAKGFSEYLSVLPEAKIAMECGVTAMHDLAEGGIFAALWEMAQGAGTGLDIDMKKIPIKQETIEICEFFGLNPYMIRSSGAILMAADDGVELVHKLNLLGIPAVVVGRTTDGNDRILRNGEDVRYLDRPKTDELYKVMG